MTIKIYLFRQTKSGLKPRKYPSFSIRLAGDQDSAKDKFDSLYQEIILGNKAYIKFGPVIFKKEVFNYAILK